MRPRSHLTLQAVLYAPGAVVLVAWAFDQMCSALGSSPGELIGIELAGSVADFARVSAFLSPLTTLLGILFTTLSYRALGTAMRWIALLLCAAAVLGTLCFWGGVSMVGYRG
jgi:hypothetical protein